MSTTRPSKKCKLTPTASPSASTQSWRKHAGYKKIRVCTFATVLSCGKTVRNSAFCQYGRKIRNRCDTFERHYLQPYAPPSNYHHSCLNNDEVVKWSCTDHHYIGYHMHYIESQRMGHVSGSFDRPRSFHTWDGLPTSQTIHTVVIEESETWVYRQPPGIIPTVAILTMAIGSLGTGNRMLLCHDD